MVCKRCKRNLDWLSAEGTPSFRDICAYCLTWQDYQEATRETAVYPKCEALQYLTLGLASEAGEVASLVKKWIRGDRECIDEELMEKELGDVLWYLARLADELQLRLNHIAVRNLNKLMERKLRGTLRGDGDNR